MHLQLAGLPITRKAPVSEVDGLGVLRDEDVLEFDVTVHDTVEVLGAAHQRAEGRLSERDPRPGG